MIKQMTNFYIILILLFIFFMFIIGEIFKMKKEIRKLNKALDYFIKERKKNE